MKKVFNILIIFMIIVFGTISVKAEVYEGHIVRGAKLSTPYYHRHDKPDTYFVEQNGFIYRTTDGSYVYCVQPFVSLNGTATYEMTIDDIWSVINMTQEQWEHIARVAYYGYGYVHGNYDHSDERWQAATQMIIWNLSDPNIISYFTRGMNGPRDDTILADEMAEIEYLVNLDIAKLEVFN